MKSKENSEVILPRNQLNLYGYDYYFNLFLNLHEKNKLPSAILLNGQKGIGKATFAYHFINFLLSRNEENFYSIKSYSINSKNYSYNCIKNFTHPNFFLLDTFSPDEHIKIQQSRNLLKFLSKTVYSKEIKIILIDNIENLNISSSNALLKAIEEPPSKTFFFLIQNDPFRVIDTIKSRCLPFNLHFSQNEKKSIFNKIINSYNINVDLNYFDKFFYFDSPGNILRYFFALKNTNLYNSKDTLSSILFLMDMYNSNKDLNLPNFITLFIEIFYNELSLKNSSNINTYFINKNKILSIIRDTNKFNLDKKNMFFTIGKILKNEAK